MKFSTLTISLIAFVCGVLTSLLGFHLFTDSNESEIAQSLKKVNPAKKQKYTVSESSSFYSPLELPNKAAHSNSNNEHPVRYEDSESEENSLEEDTPVAVSETRKEYYKLVGLQTREAQRLSAEAKGDQGKYKELVAQWNKENELVVERLASLKEQLKAENDEYHQQLKKP